MTDHMLTDAEAAKCVTAFMAEMRRQTGLSQQELNMLIQELIWFHRRRKRYAQWGDWAARSFITAFVAAFLGGLGWVFVHVVRTIAGKG